MQLIIVDNIFFQGKGRGFLSTVAGIFKTSSASPSPTASPSHQTKPTKEDSFLGRFSRKDGAKKRDEDVRELVTRTASLAMQASHPSTPPVPLSRLGNISFSQRSTSTFSHLGNTAFSQRFTFTFSHLGNILFSKGITFTSSHLKSTAFSQ